MKAPVCANSEDSRESVRSLESALICADFYNSSKSKYSLHFLHVYRKKYGIIVYENINLSFFENKKSSDSVLKFLIARQQWIETLARTFSGPK